MAKKKEEIAQTAETEKERAMTLRVPEELRAEVDRIHRTTGIKVSKIREILEEEVFSRSINLTSVVRRRLFGEPPPLMFVGEKFSDEEAEAIKREMERPSAAMQASDYRAPSGSIAKALKG